MESSFFYWTTRDQKQSKLNQNPNLLDKSRYISFQEIF